MFTSRFITPLVSAIGVAVLFIFLLSFSTPLIQSIIIGAGLTLVYFLPGLMWTYIFWPDTKRPDTKIKHGSETTDENRHLQFLPRFILSFLLSLVLIPIGILIGNRFNMPIATDTIYFVALTVIVLGALILFLQSRRSRN